MDIAVTVKAIPKTRRVSLRKPDLIRVVIPCPVVYQAAGIGFSAGIAVLYYAAAIEVQLLRQTKLHFHMKKNDIQKVMKKI